MKNTSILWALMVFVVLCERALMGNPIEDVFGASQRVQAMGAAGTVLSRDFSATFYNPANLSLCQDNQLSLGYEYLHTNLKTSATPKSTKSGQIGDHHISRFGLCLKLPDHFHLGFNFAQGIQHPVGVNIRTANERPEFTMYGDGLSLPSIMIGFAYAPIEQISIGLAGSFTTSASMSHDLVVPMASKKPLDIVFRGQISISTRFIVGVNIMPLPEVRVGFSFRSAMFGAVKHMANSSINISGVRLDVEQILETMLGYSPAQLALGVGYEPSERWTLGAELTWYDWSDYPGPFFNIYPVEESTVAKTLNYPQFEPANFGDSLVPRIGAEFRPAKWMALRAGYSFRSTPAPIPAKITNLLDGSTHTFSIGAGIKLRETEEGLFTLDVSSQLQYMPDRHVTKPGAGAYSDYTFGGVAFSSGISLTARF